LIVGRHVYKSYKEI